MLPLLLQQIVKTAGKVRDGCAATVSVVNSCVALRRREELQPDCGTRVRVSKGKDGRTYIAAGMNRRCFKDLSPLGSFENRRGVFGLASGISQSKDCTVCVASAIFEEQKIALEKIVDDGGSSCCIFLGNGFDTYAHCFDVRNCDRPY